MRKVKQNNPVIINVFASYDDLKSALYSLVFINLLIFDNIQGGLEDGGCLERYHKTGELCCRETGLFGVRLILIKT